MEVEQGMYRIVASETDSQFGGDEFTDVLQDFLTAEFNRCVSIMTNLSVTSFE